MRVVVAHSGPRDGYQVGAALSEAGQLDSLVTDLYWPHDRWLAQRLEQVTRREWADALRFRSHSGLPSKNVNCCTFSGFCALAMRKMPAPFRWKRASMRWSDAQIGRCAAKRAGQSHAALLSYSYYGYHAFSESPGNTCKILFQLHPHPLSVRDILSRQLREHPECASSLLQEWELSLPESDFNRLVAETHMANHWIVASSFTQQTLVENGLPSERIHVVPYGIDAKWFAPLRRKRSDAGPLKLLFVGTINQRKGIQYLLKALDRLERGVAELIVCGRVVDDLGIFRSCQSRVEIRPSVSERELLAAYQSADLFVFPTLAEGFAHVLLEAMATGLPVLTTTRSAAPDLIRDDVEGYVIEPEDVDQLTERIQWFADNRHRLEEMGKAARRRAETFTWPRFRERIAAVVRDAAGAC